MPLEETVLNVDGVQTVKQLTIANIYPNVPIVTTPTTHTWKTEEFSRNALDATKSRSISVQTVTISPSLSMLCVEIAIKHLIAVVLVIMVVVTGDFIPLPVSCNYLNATLKYART